MIKRLRKFKKSKQGAILILVVLILALAMIFIASAMMLTQATRTRLYENTLTTQTRLTVTSAVEVFLEALETQEITDNQLDAVIKSARAESNADKIRMVVNGVPGMSGDNLQNATFVDIYYPDDTNPKIVNCDFTTTIGDEEENVRVVLHVQNSNPSYGGRFRNQVEIANDTSERGLFFTHGIGMVNPDYLTYVSGTTELDGSSKEASYLQDNTILLRGSAYETASGSVFYSDYIISGATPIFKTGNAYNGKMVFLDGAYMSTEASVSGGFNGDFYFIGRDDEHPYDGLSFTNDGGWSDISNTTNFVFSGRTVENNTSSINGKVSSAVRGNWSSGTTTRNVYFLDSDGNCVMNGATRLEKMEAKNSSGTYYVDNAAYSGTVPSEIDFFTDLYRSDSYNYGAAANAFPSRARDVMKSMNVDGLTKDLPAGYTCTHDEYGIDKTIYEKGSTIPEGGATVIMNPITEEFPFKDDEGNVDSKYVFALTADNLAAKATNNVINLPANGANNGYYYFTSDGGAICNGGGDPYIITIDGSKAASYRFYFAAGNNFNLCSVVFAMYNVDANNTPCVFVLEEGATVHLSDEHARDAAALCPAGFISINRDDCGSASALATYIKDSALAKDSDEAKDWSGTWTNVDGDEVSAVYTKSDGTTRIKYSSYYDSFTKPACYIFGSGSNQFLVNGSAIVEAYVGLYNGSHFGADNNTLSHSYPAYIYGRVECNSLFMGSAGAGSNGAFCMPYCPQPSDTSSQFNSRRAESKYKVADLTYYTILPE